MAKYIQQISSPTLYLDSDILFYNGICYSKFEIITFTNYLLLYGIFKLNKPNRNIYAIGFTVIHATNNLLCTNSIFFSYLDLLNLFLSLINDK
jgi:hypothetical protein